jgi:hypothetical protein
MISNSSKKSCIFNDATSQEFPQSAIFSSLEDTILPENPVRFIDALSAYHYKL